MRCYKLLAALIVMMAVSIKADVAQAGFVIRISDGFTTETFTYGVFASGKTDGVDLDGNTTMTILKAIGDFNVSFEVATTNSPGSPTLAFLTQSGNTITNRVGAARTLTIEITSTDYTEPASPPAPAVVLGSTLSGTVVTGNLSGVTFNSYIGLGNSEFQQSIDAPQIGPLSAGGPSGGLSGQTHKPGITPLPTPYSLTSILVATFSGNASVSNLTGNTTLTEDPDFQTVIPEPGTIAMAITALPLACVGYYVRRRSSN